MKRSSALLLAMALGAGLPVVASAQGVPADRGARHDGDGRPDRVPAPDRPDDPRRAGRFDDAGRAGGGWANDGGGFDDRRGNADRRWAGNGQDGRNPDRRYAGQWNGGWRQDGRYDWRDDRNANRDRFAGRRYVPPRGWANGYRRFGIGAAVPGLFWDRNYWLADPHAYHLPPANGPYRWVRYYDDVLLMDLRSGRVADMVPGFFR